MDKAMLREEHFQDNSSQVTSLIKKAFEIVATGIFDIFSKHGSTM